MRSRVSRSTCRLLIVAILVTTLLPYLPPGAGLAEAQADSATAIEAWPPGTLELAYTVDPSASSYFVAELEEAYNYGLTYPAIMSNFGWKITREEFCTIVVKLYEKLSGQTVIAGPSPFTDTSNPEIVKAAQLQIVNGVGGGLFAPLNKITRQEICVMILRCLGKALSALDTSTEGPFPFADAGLIASWASTAMRFCYKNEIMKGVSATTIDPLNNTTREQAVVLLKRTYVKYSPEIASDPGTPPQLPPGAPEIIEGTALLSGPTPAVPEKTKFIEQDWVHDLAGPAYATKLELYTSTEPGRPPTKPASAYELAAPETSSIAALNLSALASLNADVLSLGTWDTEQVGLILTPITPIIPWTMPRPDGPVYSRSPYSFVDKGGDRVRWFAFTLSTSQAAKVVWQVSRAPFTGSAQGWRTPQGLLLSGEVTGTTREFSVDFGAVAAAVESTPLALLPFTPLPGLQLTTAREIPRPQRSFYVRAVPVDAGGNPIGDPGTGVPVLYGQAAPPANRQGINLGVSYQLWAPRFQGEPTTGGEFPNSLLHDSLSRGFGCEYSGAFWFQPRAYDPETTAFVIQVSQKPFASTSANWSQPAGMVYSRRYERPVVVLSSFWTDVMPVPFHDFGPPQSALPADYFLNYHVRVVAVKPSATPGCEDVSFSETIQVSYGWASPPKIYTPMEVVAKSYTPTVKIKEYQPAKHQDVNWAQYYEVFRAPRWNEINCKFRNVQTGVVLRPYALELMSNPGLTVEQYEKNVIPQVLVKGTKVRIVPKEDDKSWWEDLWDGITSFFSDLWAVVKGVTNWVANAYNNLKQGLINWVASALPIPGLRTALEWMVNYGLMAMGLPPTLPTFDQLTSMSLDYMAQVALTEAGLPANEITSDLVAKTATAIGDEMGKATAVSTPNPINSPFLKADPAHLTRPAYVDIEVRNPYTDKATRPGTLNVDIEWEWRETGYSLVHETWGNLPIDQQYADALNYTMHFVYGLKRGHAGYPVYYPVYEPIRGYPIPILQPGETRRVRLYLEAYIGKPYPFAVLGDKVLGEDFANLYWGQCGAVQFSVSTGDFNLGDPKQVAIEQGHVPVPDKYIYTYRFDWSGSGSTFTGLPHQGKILP